MDPGAASWGRVAPLIARTGFDGVAALLRRCATSGAEVMKSTSPREERLLAVLGVVLLRECAVGQDHLHARDAQPTPS